jgi:hypothetical protein
MTWGDGGNAEDLIVANSNGDLMLTKSHLTKHAVGTV